MVEPNPSPVNEISLQFYQKLEQRIIGAIKTEDIPLLKELIPKAEAEWPSQLAELIAWAYHLIDWEDSRHEREKLANQRKYGN